MQNSTKKLGRPPAYDRAVALAAMRDLFWLKGVAATSLDDIVAVTGMNRPSLYAAFGDKRAMYFAGLESFASDVRQAVAEALDHADLRAALEHFYHGAILQYTSGPVQRGCMAVCTATLEAAGDTEAQQFLSALLYDIEEALRARFEKALVISPEVAASVAASVLHSLAIRARAGTSRRELEGVAADVISLLVPHYIERPLPLSG
jgi:TetR/AcrR family transcriptional regulator, copper-responsive repressor